MNTSNLHILIVEDEAFIAMELELMILENGMKVIGPATRVDKAIKLLDEYSPDGAILDVMLGRDEVFPLADKLLEQGVPFVFHSGHANREIIRKQYSAPVFSKPAMLDSLVHDLISLISKNAHQMESPEPSS